MIRSSDALSEISAAFVKAQAEMPGAPKDVKGQVGNQVRFYADLASVVDVSRPVLAKHGLAYIQFPTGFSNGCVELTTRLIHESGEWMEGTSVMPINQAQAVGSAITYSKRYSLQGGLGIVSEDDDGTAASVAAPAVHPPAARKASGPPMASEGQIAKLAATFKDWGVTDRDERLKHLARILKRSIPSSKDLTVQECSEAIDTIELAIRMDSEKTP